MDRWNLSIAAPLLMKEFGWNETTMGLLQSVFFYGFTLTHLPGGWLADRFGGRRVLGAGTLGWTLATGVTPLGGSFAALAAARLALGLGEGLNMPSISSLVARWFPLEERTRATVVNLTGIHTGTLQGERRGVRGAEPGDDRRRAGLRLGGRSGDCGRAARDARAQGDAGRRLRRGDGVPPRAAARPGRLRRRRLPRRRARLLRVRRQHGAGQQPGPLAAPRRGAGRPAGHGGEPRRDGVARPGRCDRRPHRRLEPELLPDRRA